jgi:tRNA-dihydrouridine synthase
MQNAPFLYLAPIQGVTNTIYRDTFYRCFAGVDSALAPFIRLPPDGKLPLGLKNSLPPYDPLLPLVPQILSNRAEDFLAFDQQLSNLGYPEFNWNLGCPVSMVTLKKRGSGLLPHADQIVALLEQILPKLRCRLSLKLRLGLNDPHEIPALLPRLNPLPISELIIHPRLGRQKYAGQVDLATFTKCLELSTLPVVYNGDIFNLAAFQGLQAKFPKIERWMLGRGVLANPFLPAQIKGLAEPADKLEKARRFHDAYAQQLAQALCGPTHSVDRLKEFWDYFQHLFPAGPGFFLKLKKIKHYTDYHAAVERFFRQMPVVSDHLLMSSEGFRN